MQHLDSKIIKILVLLGIFTVGFYSAYSQRSLKPDHPTVKRVSPVFEKLVKAAGIDPYQTPSLRVLRGKNSVGRYHGNLGDNGTVQIDEYFVNACDKRFGSKADYAIALVLGHELAHHKYGHRPDMGYGGVPKQSDDELRADLRGGYVCLLAGLYHPEINSQALDLIYEDYELDDEQTGYQSKSLRYENLAKTKDSVAQYAHLGEAGKYLYVMGGYKQATTAFFEKLSKKFPSPRVLYNLGVADWQQAQSLLGTDHPANAFMFPLEIAARNRLSGWRQGNLSPEQMAEKLLDQAISNFEYCLRMDPEFQPAWIGLCAAHILQGKLGLAQAKLDEVEEVYGSNSFAYQTMLGILHAMAKEYDEAEDHFAQARAIDENRGRYNDEWLNSLKEKSLVEEWWDSFQAWMDAEEIFSSNTPIPIDYEPSSSSYEEAIGPLRFKEDILNFDFHNSYQVSDLPPIGLTVWSLEGANKYHIDLETEDGLSYRLTMLTANWLSPYRTQAGLEIGSYKSDLLNQYGSPDRINYGLNGVEFYLYDQLQLIFELEKDCISGWATFIVEY